MSERRIALLVQYDGTDFHGWQRQLGVRTVQQTLEEAVAVMDGGQRVPLRGSSRTDAGVHSRGLPASFRTTSTIPPIGYERGLNAALPSDVAIVACAEVVPEFDVRHSGKGKVYTYRIWNGPTRSPLLARTAWYVRKPVDLDAMRRASQPLIGVLDFESFRATGCQAKNATRNLTAIRIEGRTRAEIVITVEGNAFLQHMVRIIAGTLVDVGRGNREESFVAEALAARRREAAGQTAPSHGLTLERVLYDPSPFPAR